MKEIIVFDPSVVNIQDVMEMNKRWGFPFGIVRVYPGAISPAIFFLGRRPGFWVKVLEWWFGRKKKKEAIK